MSKVGECVYAQSVKTSATVLRRTTNSTPPRRQRTSQLRDLLSSTIGNGRKGTVSSRIPLPSGPSTGREYHLRNNVVERKVPCICIKLLTNVIPPSTKKKGAISVVHSPIGECSFLKLVQVRLNNSMPIYKLGKKIVSITMLSVQSREKSCALCWLYAFLAGKAMGTSLAILITAGSETLR